MVNTLIPFKRIDQMLDNFLGSPWTSSPSWWNGPSLQLVPRADILEGEKEYLIRLDLPGVTQDSLEIGVEDQTLNIKAEREYADPEGYKAHRRELPSRVVMKRSFSLGSQIDAEHISAKLDEGVLTLTLPKSDAALPRRIEVQ